MATLESTTTSVVVTDGLARGVYFWRLRNRTSAGIESEPSATWLFSVGVRSAPLESVSPGHPDFDGDGRSEVVVGTRRGDGSPPPVYVYPGSSVFSSLAPTPIEPPADIRLSGLSSFGSTLESANDVNGDGFGDLLVFEENSGALHLYLGSPTGLAATPSMSTDLGDWGYVAYRADSFADGIGDFDADGYGDVAASVFIDDTARPGEPEAGVRVFFGGADSISVVPDAIVRPMSFESGYGIVSRAGDMNADGYSDLAVGQYGRVEIYRGNPSRSFDEPIRIVLPGTLMALRFAGDIDGDGCSDLLATVRQDAPPYAWNTYVVHGSGRFSTIQLGELLNEAPNWTWTGFFPAFIGDVNGDGIDDIALTGRVEGGSRLTVFAGSISGAVPSLIATLDLPGDGDVRVAGVSVDGDDLDDILVSRPHPVGAEVLATVRGNRDATALRLESLTTPIPRPVDFGFSLAP